MNTQHTHGSSNGSPDAGMDELSRAYGKLEQDTPPDLLDRAILNRAHRAVEEKPGWMQFGWLHGLTTAAVIVLAFSLVLQQREPLTIEEGLILESAPQLMRDESAGSDQLRQAAPTTVMKLEAGETTDSNTQTQEYREPLKQGRLLEEVTSAPAAARELEISIEAEGAPRTRAKAPALIDADFAEVIVLRESRDDAAPPDVITAQQQLAEILRLKTAGDESWKEELDDFRQKYPDYPLPAELED